eukprot:scaffold6255_cov83-Attheya_sp.AAC.1
MSQLFKWWRASRDGTIRGQSGDDNTAGLAAICCGPILSLSVLQNYSYMGAPAGCPLQEQQLGYY